MIHINSHASESRNRIGKRTRGKIENDNRDGESKIVSQQESTCDEDDADCFIWFILTEPQRSLGYRPSVQRVSKRAPVTGVLPRELFTHHKKIDCLVHSAFGALKKTAGM
jgi:hypothetical protein